MEKKIFFFSLARISMASRKISDEIFCSMMDGIYKAGCDLD